MVDLYARFFKEWLIQQPNELVLRKITSGFIASFTSEFFIQFIIICFDFYGMSETILIVGIIRRRELAQYFNNFEIFVILCIIYR